MARLDRDMPDSIKTPTSFSTVDEQTKARAKRAPVLDAVIDDSYYTKKNAQGKTQAQLKAAEAAAAVAASTGGTIDPKTGMIIPAKKRVSPVIPPVIPGKPAINVTLVSTETDSYGNVIGFYSDGTSKTLIASDNKYKSTVDSDAYTLLEKTFKDYGLEELVPDIKRFMEEGLGSNQAAVELRKLPAYTTRFKGNEVRRAAGLNVLSEGAYLELENSYNETLRSYGQQGFFGIDRKAAQGKMSDIIGNDISATEFKDRIDTVVKRVNNSDPSIKSLLRTFYNINNDDLISYFLNPKENILKLQEKVTTAEIGSAFLKQGLDYTQQRSTELAQYGVDRASALKGASIIAGILPESIKLGNVYGEENINYTQTIAEDEVLKKIDSAERKRLRLAGKEISSFSANTGLGQNALGGGKSTAF